MTPKEVKKYYRTTYNFSKLTGMSPASLLNWTNRGFVPELSQYKLEKLTKGELKATVEKPKERKLKKESIHKLMDFWVNLESQFYSKAKHLLNDVNDWQEEFGEIKENDKYYDEIKKLREVSLLNKD